MSKKRLIVRHGRADRSMHRCLRCKVKWAQREGLCRRCGREEGIYDGKEPRIDLAELAGETPLPEPPRQRRVIVVHGAEYEVVWP